MSGSFEIGPYIPVEHEQHNLLPYCRAKGGEVFSYPSMLDDVDERIRKWEAGRAGVQAGEHDAGHKNDSMRIMPYGMKSYAEYYGMLERYAVDIAPDDPQLARDIRMLEDLMKIMNVKEQWSIVRYVGDQFDEVEGLGLTKGRCYYWPCSESCPEYEGVIDDEEFTSYLYPCDSDSWEIVCDPTGMAVRALAGEVDTVDAWFIEEARADPDSLQAWALANGAVSKQKIAPGYELEEPRLWRHSERDTVTPTCPNCGEQFEFAVWTLLNVDESPEAADLLRADRLSELTCPVCGYTASLVHPCLCLMPSRRAVVYQVDYEEMRAGCIAMFDKLKHDGFSCERYRIVGNRDELREKFLLFEAELDDRAFECLKICVTGQAKLDGLVPAGAECRAVLRSIGDDGRLHLALEVGEDSYLADMPVDVLKLFSEPLAASSIASEQPYMVDRAWADHAYDVLDKEGLLG